MSCFYSLVEQVKFYDLEFGFGSTDNQIRMIIGFCQ